jgi:hypothetical protein
VLISAIPIYIEVIRNWRERRRNRAAGISSSPAPSTDDAAQEPGRHRA